MELLTIRLPYYYNTPGCRRVSTCLRRRATETGTVGSSRPCRINTGILRASALSSSSGGTSRPMLWYWMSDPTSQSFASSGRVYPWISSSVTRDSS
eukprot:7404832-Pyramimonas_sp.AAC.1